MVKQFWAGWWAAVLFVLGGLTILSGLSVNGDAVPIWLRLPIGGGLLLFSLGRCWSCVWKREGRDHL